MKKLYKWVLIGIIVAAAIAGIVHITCEYVHLAKHAEYGASPSVAFFFAIPYLAVIVLCVVIGLIIAYKKRRK